MARGPEYSRWQNEVPADLVREIERTIHPSVVRSWLEHPVSAFDGKSPREMTQSGQADAVLAEVRYLNRGYGG
jgi:hypothetical protein